MHEHQNIIIVITISTSFETTRTKVNTSREKNTIHNNYKALYTFCVYLPDVITFASDVRKVCACNGMNMNQFGVQCE